MGSRNLVIGLVASLVVLAVAAGLLVLVESVGDDDLRLPDRVGDLRATDTAAAYPGRDAPPEVLEQQRSAAEVNSEGYEDAFDGADADSRTYVDPQGDSPVFWTVVAVADDAGPLVPQGGFVDAERLGLALPPVERVTRGDVECVLVRNVPPRAGAPVEPDEAAPDAHYCQRRSGSLTVQVRAGISDTDAVVDLVNDLWDELD